MRKFIIAGNWKMYKTIGEAIELTNGLTRELVDVTGVDIVVCPTFTALTETAEVLAESNIGLGAQNCHFEDEGAFTGEISCKMVKDTGATYVIIGHSERRQYFAETNESINKKVKKALAYNLTPIVCVGETLKERESNLTFKVLTDHIENGLKGLTKEEALKIIIAYEPVWAIGTGKTATPEQAQEVHKFIRDLLIKMFNKDTAEVIRIQYGGSVKPENTSDLMKQPDIDGALVGGASLKVDSFSQIVKKASEIKK
ncbi:MAG TPA: triose-phosphate isomerase [Candidatus Omnitrophota bacterium]|nr:triose-phosphate isomerase [Candidatus Omnitrophota bacterium]HPT07595.1 triose-phosphate isomerase [Candidatus Omnitrophota bacterium]